MTLRKVLLACGPVSSVLYIVVDLFGSLRYGGYRYADQQFSELTAQGAPTRRFMLTLSVIPYTVLVSACAVGVWVSAGPRRVARMTGALLAGYALAGMVTAMVFPMRPREALAAGGGTRRNAMHIPGTAVMSLFILVAMGFGATLFGKRFRSYSYGTIISLLMAGGLVGSRAGRISANQPTPGMGLAERVNIYATMLWVAMLALGLARVRDTEP